MRKGLEPIIKSIGGNIERLENDIKDILNDERLLRQLATKEKSKSLLQFKSKYTKVLSNTTAVSLGYKRMSIMRDIATLTYYKQNLEEL
jgi:predicted component of type VI protein secretion system